MEKKLQASQEGKDKIGLKIRRGTDFSTTEDSNAISEANKIAFKWYAQEILNKNDITEETTLTFKELNNLKNQIYPQSSRGKSSYTQINNFINTLKRDQIKECTVQKVYDQEINIKGINYPSWQKFYQGKPILEIAFNAFCQVLELDPNDIADKPANTTELENKLKLFNHQDQIQEITTKTNQNQTVFIIYNKCNYSRSWMLHRLEQEINHKHGKCLIIPIRNSSNFSFNLDDFKKQINQSNFLEKLKKESIMIVLNIDYVELTSLKEIYKIWEAIYTLRENNHKHLFMLLLVTEDLNNQEREKYIQSHQCITKLNAVDYQESDVHRLIAILQKSWSHFQGIEMRSLIQKDTVDTVQLLKSVYQELKIDRNPTTLKIWSNYPWN